MIKIPLLCYHKVAPISEEGRRLNIEPDRLNSHVRYFARRGFRFVLPRDLEVQWHNRSVCFSFDDAYECTMRLAPTVLEKHGARGAFYAVSTLVGKTSSWDGELARPLADWDALRDAQARGHEIGNHSATHPHLDQLEVSDQTLELRQAHDTLVAQGINVQTVCYPYGGISAPDAVPYKVGLALGKRIATDRDDRKRLPRIVIACSDALPMLLYKLYVKPKPHDQS